MRAVALALLVVGACGSTAVELDPKDPHGVMVMMRRHGERAIAVELLACDTRHLYVRADGGRWLAWPWHEVETRKLELPDASGDMGAWTLAGVVSTISHGRILIFSAPIWLFAGIAMAYGADEELEFDHRSPGTACAKLAPYVRWPGGLPETVRGRFRR